MLVIGLGAGCVLLAGAAGFAFYQGMGLRSDLASKDSALHQSQEQNRKLEKALQAAKDLAAKAQTDLAAAKEELAQGGAAPADGTAPTAAVGTAAPAPASPAEQIMESATGKKMDLKAMFKGKSGEMIAKQNVNMMYGDLFKEMTLNPQEREQFLQVLVEGQASTMQIYADKGASNPAAYKEAQNATEAKVKQLLGDDRFKQYQTYTKQAPDRMQVAQFENSVAMSANPLKPEQKKQMIELMSSEREKFDAERKAAGTTTTAGVDYQVALNQRLTNRLGTVLSPEQLTEYGKWQESMAQLMRSFAPSPPKPATAAATPAQ